MLTATPFNTDFWYDALPGSGDYGISPAVTGQAPDQGNPALPAMAWLGILIALVLIRVLSEMS